MKNLYAPWRKKYVKQVTQGKTEYTKKEECPFCVQLAENQDEKNFIFRRFAYHAIMLNLYPYNPGHLLIVTLEHKRHINQLITEARTELIELINKSVNILEKDAGAQGINVGLNLGKASGAGIPAHVHTHVLPRWIGDTNFLPLLAQTKQISVDLKELYQELYKYFQFEL